MSYSYFNQTRPYESDWCRSNKLGYWNACSVTDLINHFGNSKWRLSYTVKTVLTRSVYSSEKFAKAIGVGEEEIKKGLITTYFSDDEISIFVESRLRICPICINRQYHSCFHQLLPLKHCPAHNVELTTKCPYCRRDFLSCWVKDIHNYFSCCNCGHLLSDLEKFDACISKKEVRAFEKIEKILLKRKLKKSVSPPLHRFKMEHNNTSFQEKVWRLWGALYGFAPLGPDLHKMRLRHNFYLDSTYGYRYLPKKIFEMVKKHEWCVNEIGILGFWIRSGVEIREVRLCPYALAFIFFRMYWESKDSGHGIHFEYASPDKYYKYVDSDASAYKVLIKELEYVEMFKGCLSLATAAFDQVVVRVPSPEEIASHSIYWEAIKPSKEMDGTIIYFQPRGEYHEPILGPLDSHFKDLEDSLERIIRQVSGISKFCKNWPDHPICRKVD